VDQQVAVIAFCFIPDGQDEVDYALLIGCCFVFCHGALSANIKYGRQKNTSGVNRVTPPPNVFRRTFPAEKCLHDFKGL